MREILFRGKLLDNGEWVHGSLISWADGSRSIESGKLDTPMWCVIPETVGQYTGLTDKNGKKIFEGDIIKAYVCDHEFEDEYLSYTPIKVTFCGGYFYPFHLEGCWRSGVSDIEVIGNIHDNPELLEVIHE